MLGNEQLTTKRSEAALELEDLPGSTKGVIRMNYQDEQRHLGWIRHAIETRIWEQESTVSPR